jgi:phosphohistidine phosphatase
VEIYLVRHGIAEDPGPGQRDSERALTPEGREKAARIAKNLRRELGDGVAIIVHSPFLRARETAEIFHRQFTEASLHVGPGLTPNDNPEEGLATALAFAAKKRSVMIVGHEPSLSSLASILLTGDVQANVQFKKAAVAGFEWAGKGFSRLLFLLPPRFLLH